MVLRELAKIGFSKIREVVRWGETMVRMVDVEEGEAEDIVHHCGLGVAAGKFQAQIDREVVDIHAKYDKAQPKAKAYT